MLPTNYSFKNLIYIYIYIYMCVCVCVCVLTGFDFNLPKSITNTWCSPFYIMMINEIASLLLFLVDITPLLSLQWRQFHPGTSICRALYKNSKWQKWLVSKEKVAGDKDDMKRWRWIHKKRKSQTRGYIKNTTLFIISVSTSLWTDFKSGRYEVIFLNQWRNC